MSAPEDAPVLPEPADVVEQQLVLLLRRARAGFEQLAREVHPGLEPAAYAILHLVAAQEATTVTALAERLSVGKPTLSRQVAALVELGLLERRPGQDGRSVQLRLTAEGRVRFTTARRRRQEQFRGLLAEWDEPDVVALGALLGRLNSLAW